MGNHAQKNHHGNGAHHTPLTTLYPEEPDDAAARNAAYHFEPGMEVIAPFGQGLRVGHIEALDKQTGKALIRFQGARASVPCGAHQLARPQ